MIYGQQKVKLRDQNQNLNSQALPVQMGVMELDYSCLYFHPCHIPLNQVMSLLAKGHPSCRKIISYCVQSIVIRFKTDVHTLLHKGQEVQGVGSSLLVKTPSDLLDQRWFKKFQWEFCMQRECEGLILILRSITVHCTGCNPHVP